MQGATKRARGLRPKGRSPILGHLKFETCPQIDDSESSGSRSRSGCLPRALHSHTSQCAEVPIHLTPLGTAAVGQEDLASCSLKCLLFALFSFFSLSFFGNFSHRDGHCKRFM